MDLFWSFIIDGYHDTVLIVFSDPAAAQRCGDGSKPGGNHIPFPCHHNVLIYPRARTILDVSHQRHQSPGWSSSWSKRGSRQTEVVGCESGALAHQPVRCCSLLGRILTPQCLCRSCTAWAAYAAGTRCELLWSRGCFLLPAFTREQSWLVQEQADNAGTGMGPWVLHG